MASDLDELRGRVIGAAIEVHRTLGAGFLESVYRNALLWELSRAEIKALPEQALKVHYKSVQVVTFVADILVENTLILELKAASALSSADEQQLVNYLKATGLDEGLLLNFGTPKVEVRRKVRHLPLPSFNDLQPTQ
jgi:GxxExxY protein